MPAVSICIPASSDTHALEASLDSIVVQKFLDYEVIVTDPSSGGSLERLVGSYDFGGRLRYFRHCHATSEALNRDEALRLSQSPLIKLLWPGDRLANPHSLGRFVALLSDAPDAILACSAVETDTGALQPAPDLAAQIRMRRQPETLLIDGAIGGLSTTIYRRSAHLEFDPRLATLAGTDLYIRALRLSPRLAVCEEPLVIHSEREAKADDIAQLNEMLLVFGKAVDLLQNDPAFQRHFWQELRRLGIRNARQLTKIAVLSPALSDYFEHLFAHPPREAGAGLLSRLGKLWGGTGRIA